MVELDEVLAKSQRAGVPFGGPDAAQVVLDHDAKARILYGRPPPRTLVEHHDPLPVLVGLGQQALQTIIEIPRLVARAKDTDPGPTHLCGRCANAGFLFRGRGTHGVICSS